MTHIKTIMTKCFSRGKVQTLIGFENYDEALRIAEERNLELCIISEPTNTQWYVEYYLGCDNYIDGVAEMLEDMDDVDKVTAFHQGDNFIDEVWNNLMSVSEKDLSMKDLRDYINMRYKVSLAVENLKGDEILLDFDFDDFVIISEQRTRFEVFDTTYYLAAIPK